MFYVFQNLMIECFYVLSFFCIKYIAIIIHNTVMSVSVSVLKQKRSRSLQRYNTYFKYCVFVVVHQIMQGPVGFCALGVH